MKKVIFKGVGTAIVTPFKNGKIDLNSLEIMLKRQIDAKIDAIIVLGTTGEPCTLTNIERVRIINKTVEVCKGKTKIIVGCGSNNTKTAIKFYKQAQSLGADAALVVTPYYNKCTQDGLVDYYKQISNTGTLPIIAYNVPSRTGINILPKTAKEIAKIKNIYGIKDCCGNIYQILDLFYEINDSIAIYSGDDLLNSIFQQLGGMGSISVFSNIMPKLSKEIYKLYEQTNILLFNKVYNDILPLIRDLSMETNPIPIKAALFYLGLCNNELRSPLTKLSPDNFEKLKTDINKVLNNYDCL